MKHIATLLTIALFALAYFTNHLNLFFTGGLVVSIIMFTWAFWVTRTPARSKK